MRHAVEFMEKFVGRPLNGMIRLRNYKTIGVLHMNQPNWYEEVLKRKEYSYCRYTKIIADQKCVR